MNENFDASDAEEFGTGSEDRQRQGGADHVFTR